MPSEEYLFPVSCLITTSTCFNRTLPLSRGKYVSHEYNYFCLISDFLIFALANWFTSAPCPSIPSTLDASCRKKITWKISLEIILIICSCHQVKFQLLQLFRYCNIRDLHTDSAAPSTPPLVPPPDTGWLIRLRES